MIGRHLADHLALGRSKCFQFSNFCVLEQLSYLVYSFLRLPTTSYMSGGMFVRYEKSMDQTPTSLSLSTRMALSPYTKTLISATSDSTQNIADNPSEILAELSL